MPQPVHQDQDLYKTVRNGEETLVQRCKRCWYVKNGYNDETHGFNIVDDNGFTPADQPYEHVGDCPNAGAF